MIFLSKFYILRVLQRNLTDQSVYRKNIDAARQKKSPKRYWSIPSGLFTLKNGGERVGFSQPPVELKLALQDSLFQEVIL